MGPRAAPAGRVDDQGPATLPPRPGPDLCPGSCRRRTRQFGRRDRLIGDRDAGYDEGGWPVERVDGGADRRTWRHARAMSLLRRHPAGRRAARSGWTPPAITGPTPGPGPRPALAAGRARAATSRSTTDSPVLDQRIVEAMAGHARRRGRDRLGRVRVARARWFNGLADDGHTPLDVPVALDRLRGVRRRAGRGALRGLAVRRRRRAGRRAPGDGPRAVGQLRGVPGALAGRGSPHHRPGGGRRPRRPRVDGALRRAARRRGRGSGCCAAP